MNIEIFREILIRIGNQEYGPAYSILSNSEFTPEDNAIAQSLKQILYAQFHKMRSSKLNSLNLLKSLGFNPMSVIDVGAQLGTPDLVKVFPDSKHLLIEPVVECIPTLQAEAAILKDAYVINCAVSDFDGLTTLSLSDTKQYSSVESEIGNESREIQVFTVDTLASIHNITSDTLLKIDVDGIEMKVLKGANRLLKNENIVVIVEASLGDPNPRFSPLVSHMLEEGYKVFDVIEPLYKNNWQLWQVDIIFIKNSSPYWGTMLYD
jgi:FkbM family methyltransferase